MEATAGKLNELIQGNTKRFIIPHYQREYSWKMKDCETLLSDLQTSFKNNYSAHFFGSIVYHCKGAGRLTNYYLIDGQQRISTVFILLIAIKNLSEEMGYTSIDPDDISNKYLIDDSTKEVKLKLKMIASDEESLKKIINNNFSKNESQLIANYSYFYNKLSELQESDVLGIYSAIDALQIVFISLDLDRGDNPQLIFESLNSKGVKLSEADKIRNYVLMNHDSDELDNIYDTYWEPFEETVGKQNLGKFFRYYITKHTYVLPKEDSLYFAFKEFRNANYKDVEPLMQNMMVYANYFKIISEAKRSDSGYKGAISRLVYLDVNTSIPLIFDFFDAQSTGKLSDAEFDEAMSVLESYYVRRIFCTEAVSSLNKTFVSMSRDIQRIMADTGARYIDALKYTVLIRTGKTRFPKDAEFEDRFKSFELYNSKPQFRKYIFERLENYNVKAPDRIIDAIDDGTYTIEHIMPQTLTKEWKKYLGKDWDKIQSRYLHTIGNLTITEYNSEYSNLLFEKKRDLPEKGFASSKIHINRDISTCEKWDEAAINTHASKMLSRAKNIWKLPKTTISIKDEFEVLTLEDDIDFREFIMCSFKLLGEEIDANNFIEMFRKLCSNLYAIDPVKYANYKSTFQDKSPSGYKKYFEINTNLYISLDGDDAERLTYLRNICLHLGFELDDIEFKLKRKEKFDILKEATYQYAKAGEFARESFKYLFDHELLSMSDIQLLLDTTWTREEFPKSVYAVLSQDRMAGSTTNVKNNKTTHTRYYSDPIEYKELTLYLSSQWYPYTKDSLIAYFKKKRDF